MSNRGHRRAGMSVCTVPGCGRWNTSHSLHCVRHHMMLNRHGITSGRIVKWNEVKMQIAFAQEQAAIMRANHATAYEWAITTCHEVLHFTPHDFSRPQRDASYLLRCLPFVEDPPAMLVRLLAVETAVHYRAPNWPTKDAEALARGRLLICACGRGRSISAIKRGARREIGTRVMESGLPALCEKWLATRDARAEQRRLAKAEAFASLEQPTGGA